MTLVLGVDGCPQGWCTVSLDTDTDALGPAHFATFREVGWQLTPPSSPSTSRSGSWKAPAAATVIARPAPSSAGRE
ncbi:MAG: hypothetical protein WD904_02200 [Dehalococcoidia bacterium]